MTKQDAPLNAKQIYQAHLDQTTQLFWNQDFDALLDLMKLPARMAAIDAAAWVDDPVALKKSFETQRESLVRIGARDYYRICTKATFHDDTQTVINGEHTVYVMKGGDYVLDPYQCQMRLVLEDARWMANGITSAVSNLDYTIIDPTLPKPSEEPENDSVKGHIV